MITELIKTLKQARKDAKKEGVRAYRGDLRVYFYDEHFFLLNFKKNGGISRHDAPFPEILRNKGFECRRLLWVLEAAKKIDRQSEIEDKPPWRVAIKGGNARQKFSIELPFLKL